MALPTKRTPKVTDPMRYSILLFGPGGIGKSTWASHADSAIFLATENGLNSLEVYQESIGNWDHMRKTCTELAAGKHDFKTVIIDTVDQAYHQLAAAVCKENGVSHAGEGAHGAIYGLINTRFREWAYKLTSLPYGVVFIGHSKEKEYETRTGKNTVTQLGIPDTPRAMICELMDIVLLARNEVVTDKDGNSNEVRLCRSRGTSSYYAKDRTGQLPPTLPLDYSAFTKAFQTATNTTTATKKDKTK